MEYANQPGIQFLSEMNEQKTEAVPVIEPIGKEQLQKFTEVLQRYKAGKAKTERRVIASENWWKLRNASEEETDGREHWTGFRSQSSWIHNIIVSKHADALDSYPMPTILPRERNDEQEAKKLSSILPCVLEQNKFESTYSDVMWQKLKTGTGIYKVIWDKDKLNGLGDISIERANLLNVYWEPGVTDIQKSMYFFDTELVDKAVVEQLYPQAKGNIRGNLFTASKFQFDDSVDTAEKVTVIGVYYRKNGMLHYCKYCGDIVLESTENMGMQSLYDHNLYPYVFDPLFPIEGSPCGYGFVDIERNPQTEIDLMRTAIVLNAMQGATPRYFVRADGTVNEEELLDLTKPLVHVNGGLGDESIRPMQHASLDGNYVSMLQETINELRETSGNTEASTGVASSSVTAASAIAALQEASGKTSRDSTRSSYRCFSRIIELCVELIRQFYDVPRQFRITGEMGEQQFVEYDNSGIRPQEQGIDFGIDMGYRLPVFDITIDAQKKSQYTQLSQNELALQFYQLGFFNPQNADMALGCIEMMQFTGKEKLQQRLVQQQTLMAQLQNMTQYAAALAMKHGDAQAMNQLGAMNAQIMGQQMPNAIGEAKMPVEGRTDSNESTNVSNARQRSQEATQPE